MVILKKKKIVVVLTVLMTLTSVIVNDNAAAIDFDPFASGEKTTPSSPVNAPDEGPVIPQIQLSNNDISMALQIISDATGWSIFPTAEVSKAKVSLWAKDITAKQFLDTVVTLAGFIYHRQDNVITVMTYDEYMQYHGLAKKVITLEYAGADSIATVIKPFLTKLGKSVVHKETNTIVLYEADANLEFVAEIIKKLDTPSENIAVEVINLKYADCESAAKILQDIFGSQKKTAKNKSAGTAESATATKSENTEQAENSGTENALIPCEQAEIYAVSHANQLVIVGTKANIQRVKDIVAMIDIYGDNMVLEVIRLEYTDAEILAETFQKMFSNNQSKDKNKNIQKENILPERSDRQKSEPQVESEAVPLSPQAYAEVYSIGRTNQLIIKASRCVVEELKTLIEKLDTFVEPTTKNYHFTYVDAAEIYKGLERTLDISDRDSGQNRQGSNRSSRGGITLVEKTNSILLTGPPSVHRIMASIIETVDVPGMYELGMIRVYKIENADVDEIAKTIQELIESKDTQKDKTGEPKFGQSASAVPATSPAAMGETEEFVPRIEAKVSVNKSTNSVVVQATTRQHRELEKLIKELDKRRKQVLIKVMIIEITTNDDLDLGIELNHSGTDGMAFTSFGLSSIDPVTGAREIIVGPGGTAAVLRPDKIQAILKALQSNANIRIESAPQILVNDNAAGTIVSIAEEPTTQTNQGQTTTTTSFAGFVEAGTQFAIVPHISENDYLRVEYKITLNSFGKKGDPALPPARNTSNIQSEATVPNGSTIVVGGLQTSNESQSIDKVPLLGDIPLAGLLFRNTVTRKQYLTTYLFITTTIMKNEDFTDLKDVSRKALEEVEENGSNQKPDTRAAGLE